MLELLEVDGGCDVRLVSSLAPRNRVLKAVAKVARPMVRYGHDWVLNTGARQFASRSPTVDRTPGPFVLDAIGIGLRYLLRRDRLGSGHGLLGGREGLGHRVLAECEQQDGDVLSVDREDRAGELDCGLRAQLRDDGQIGIRRDLLQHQRELGRAAHVLDLAESGVDRLRQGGRWLGHLRLACVGEDLVPCVQVSLMVAHRGLHEGRHGRRHCAELVGLRSLERRAVGVHREHFEARGERRRS